jgi:hypothetical protein
MAPEEGTAMLICRNCLEILEYIELPKNMTRFGNMLL